MASKPAIYTRQLDKITRRATSWLVPGFVPVGALTLIDGDPGTGKSTLSIDLAARITTGRAMPAGYERPPTRVIIVQPEDGATIIHDRLLAAAGDPALVEIIDRRSRTSRRPIDLGKDARLLDALCARPEVGLLIIDSLALVLRGAHTEGATREALYRLAQSAHRTDTSVIAIRHRTKARTRTAAMAGAGMVAIAGAARSVTIVAPAPDDPSVGVWASAKSALGPTPPSVAFQTISTDCGPSIEWMGTSQWSADDLLRTTTGRATKFEAAQGLLQDLLADGPRTRNEIKREADRRSIGWRTVEEAKRELGVTSRQHPEPGVQGPGPSWWTLPRETRTPT